MKKLVIFELIFFISLIFSSCISMSKKQQQKHILSPPSMSKTTEEVLQSQYFSEGEWPEKEWWIMFQSEELNALMQIAIKKNPSIKAAQQKIEYAKELANQRKSKLFPLIFFDANESWEYLSKNGLDKKLNPSISQHANLIDLSLSFDYEFDFWRKNRNLFDAALGEKRAKEAESYQVELMITSALAQSYFALKTNLKREDLYQKLFEVRTNILNLQNLLLKKALLSKLPLYLSEEKQQESQKLLLSIKEEIKANFHLINILTGNGPDTPLEINTILPDLPQTISTPENLSLDLLSRRADLMAAIWRVEALGHEVGAAVADYFPNINLMGLIGFESIAYSHLLDFNSRTGGLFPAIHLPVFTAGKIRSNVRGKKALFQEAVYQYNELLLESTKEVVDMLVLTLTLYEKRESQRIILENSLSRLELTKLLNEKGLKNILDMYYEEEEVISKQLEDVELLFGQYLAVTKLIKAYGGGYLSGYSPPLKSELEIRKP